MTARNRFLITAAYLCHLLLAPPLVTSQLLSAQSDPADEKSDEARQSAGSPCAPQKAQAQEKEGAIICAIQQEKDGPIYKLHGSAEIHYGTYVVRADEVTYNAETADATATGNFTVDGGPNDDHIRASHGTYNLTAETGRFYDVTGTTGLRFRGNRVLLTSTAPFAFTGKVVERTSPDRY